MNEENDIELAEKTFRREALCRDVGLPYEFEYQEYEDNDEKSEQVSDRYDRWMQATSEEKCAWLAQAAERLHDIERSYLGDNRELYHAIDEAKALKKRYRKLDRQFHLLYTLILSVQFEIEHQWREEMSTD